jgi:hypothetical protein
MLSDGARCEMSIELRHLQQEVRDALAELFIDGRWVSARAGAKREIRCPADNSLVAEIDEAGPEDTEAAIAAARAAFDLNVWSRTPVAERGAFLLRVADLLQRDRARDGADGVARHRQAPRRERVRHRRRDVSLSPLRRTRDRGAVRLVRSRGGANRRRGARRRTQHGGPRTDRRLCTDHPWNYPLLQASLEGRPGLDGRQHLRAQALARSPRTRRPPDPPPRRGRRARRVANLVLGTGATAGAPLSTDPRVDLVSFTGSLSTGKALMRNAADTVKRIALELGGKNPNIVFADDRRSLGGRPRQRPHRGLLALRAGLLRRRSAPGRGIHPRRVRGRVQRARPRRSASAARSTTTPRPVPWSRPITWPRWRRTSRRLAPRGRWCVRVAPGSPTAPCPRLLLRSHRARRMLERDDHAFRTSRSARS